MKEFTYTVTDPVGIHARPASELVRELKGYTSDVKVVKNGKAANAKSIMVIMSLGVSCGDTVTVQVTGENEEAEVAKLEEYFKAKL